MFYTYDEFITENDYNLPDSVQDIINKINQKFSTSITSAKPPIQKNVMWMGGRIKTSSTLPPPPPPPLSLSKEMVPADAVEENKVKINTQMIRISLNKLSLKNYVIQKEVIMTSLTFFVNNNDVDELNKIIDLMYTIITSNIFFNEVYCKLYNDLQKLFPFLEKKLFTSFTNFFSMLTETIVDSSLMTFDELCVYNTSKVERKALALFYAQMSNLGKITLYDILALLGKIEQFICSIDHMDIKDELVDIICIIFSKCNSVIKHNVAWILYIKQLRLFTEYPKISKKSIIMILNAIE